MMNKYFFPVHVCLILVLACTCVHAWYHGFLPPRMFMDLPVDETLFSGKIRGKVSAEKHRTGALADSGAIISRNLFQVTVDGSRHTVKEETPRDLNMEPTRLELVLWGTVTGKNCLFAVIEDKKQGHQRLYREGDEVQGAKIRKILRHGVILTRSGNDELLEMTEESKSADIVKERSFFRENVEAIIPVQPMSEIYTNWQSPSQVRSHVNMRPHFMEDRMDGMMLYGIHSLSPFRKLGLRNGDIITHINGRQIVDEYDKDALLTQLAREGRTNITIIRGGQERQVSYHNQKGKYEKIFQ